MLRIAKKIINNESVILSFLGDSVTQGCFAENEAVDPEAAFPNLLKQMIQAMYSAANVEVINAGIGGNVSGMGLYRMKSDVLDKNPDFCCVNFALNDVLTYILEDDAIGTSALEGLLSQMSAGTDSKYLELIKQCKAKDAYKYAMNCIFNELYSQGIETVLLTPNSLNTRSCDSLTPQLTMFSSMTAKLQNSGVFDCIVETAKSIAHTYSVPIADCYSKWKTMRENGEDINMMLANGINHPTREMHWLFAEVLYEVIFEHPFSPALLDKLKLRKA
jgi:lysophospholipase L1-like esterase